MKASLSSLGTKGSEYDLIWVRGFPPWNRRTKHEPRIWRYGSRESCMAEWKRFFAKAAKSFENQCETEGARSHQSLWKPFRFWFGSFTFWDGGFGATVSHLMVPELEQRSARALPARNRSETDVPFPVKNKCATADSTPGTNILPPAQTHWAWGAWCQNT